MAGSSFRLLNGVAGSSVAQEERGTGVAQANLVLEQQVDKTFDETCLRISARGRELDAEERDVWKIEDLDERIVRIKKIGQQYSELSHTLRMATLERRNWKAELDVSPSSDQSSKDQLRSPSSSPNSSPSSSTSSWQETYSSKFLKAAIRYVCGEMEPPQKED